MKVYDDNARDTFNAVIGMDCDNEDCDNVVGLVSEAGIYGTFYGELMLLICGECEPEGVNTYTTCRNCHEVTKKSLLLSIYVSHPHYLCCPDCSHHITNGESGYCTCC